MMSASLRTRSARSVMSSRLPMGVDTKNNFPGYFMEARMGLSENRESIRGFFPHHRKHDNIGAIVGVGTLDEDRLAGFGKQAEGAENFFVAKPKLQPDL